MGDRGNLCSVSIRGLWVWDAGPGLTHNGRGCQSQAEEGMSTEPSPHPEPVSVTPNHGQAGLPGAVSLPLITAETVILQPMGCTSTTHETHSKPDLWSCARTCMCVEAGRQLFCLLSTQLPSVAKQDSQRWKPRAHPHVTMSNWATTGENSTGQKVAQQGPLSLTVWREGDAACPPCPTWLDTKICDSCCRAQVEGVPAGEGRAISCDDCPSPKHSLNVGCFKPVCLFVGTSQRFPLEVFHCTSCAVGTAASP